MSAAHEHHGPKWLAHHFDSPKQQFDAAKLGMWLFLGQEILFFSGLFVAYGIFRAWYPDSFRVGSHLLDWQMGGVNTCVLLASSLTAAFAVRSAQMGDQKKTTMWLLATIVGAFGFLIIKYFEYSHKFHVGFLPGDFFLYVERATDGTITSYNEHGVAELAAVVDKLGMETVPYHLKSFFGIYFMMTGVHGVHVVIGIFVIAWIAKRNASGEFSAQYNTAVDSVALYWHLVDLIWIFLFPLLYLID